VFLAPRVVKESPRISGYLDLPGALAGTGGVVMLVYGFIHAAANGWTAPFTLGSFALAGALLVLFLFIELRSQQPIVPLHIFVERNRAGGYLSMLLVAATMFSILFFLTQFLQEILHFSPLVAGLAFLPWMLTIFAVARVILRLVPRFGMKRIIVVGAICLIAAMLWIAQITATSDYLTGILGPMALFGIGIGCTFLPLNMLILAKVRPQDAGAAGSVLQTMTQVGGSLGLAILVAVFGNTLRSSTAQAMPQMNPLLQMRVALAHAIASAFGVGTCFAVGIGVVATLTIAAPSRRRSVLSHRPGGEAVRRRRPTVSAASR
jgi:predicted MFS family arabinose efflux permease